MTGQPYLINANKFVKLLLIYFNDPPFFTLLANLQNPGGLCVKVINKQTTERCLSGNSTPANHAPQSAALTTTPLTDLLPRRQYAYRVKSAKCQEISFFQENSTQYSKHSETNLNLLINSVVRVRNIRIIDTR